MEEVNSHYLFSLNLYPSAELPYPLALSVFIEVAWHPSGGQSTGAGCSKVKIDSKAGLLWQEVDQVPAYLGTLPNC